MSILEAWWRVAVLNPIFLVVYVAFGLLSIGWPWGLFYIVAMPLAILAGITIAQGIVRLLWE